MEPFHYSAGFCSRLVSPSVLVYTPQYWHSTGTVLPLYSIVPPNRKIMGIIKMRFKAMPGRSIMCNTLRLKQCKLKIPRRYKFCGNVLYFTTLVLPYKCNPLSISLHLKSLISSDYFCFRYYNMYRKI